MNNKILLLAFSFLVAQLAAQTWTKMTNFGGAGRNHAIGFSHGTKGYVMTGESASQYKDFWEYDSGTNSWKQLPNYPGVARSYGIGYVVNDKVYIGFGHTSTTSAANTKDWWEYDFNTTTWTQKTSFPGVGRDHPGCEMVNGKIYVGFGDNSNGNYKDWWMYDPAADSWTAKANYPGLAMHHPVAAAYNGLIYISQGHNSGGGTKNFYSYNTTSDSWVQLAQMPGPGVVAGASFYIGNNKIYSGCGITEPAGAFHNEFYAYDISAAAWSSIANYPGSGVFGPVSFVIGNAGYVVTGMDVTNSMDSQDNYRLALMIALDAGISSITTPNGTTCNSTFSPVVKIQNFGTATLTSCTINYQVDSNPSQTYSWTGSLATNVSANVTLPAITVSAGTHTFIGSTSNPNGSSDGNPGNDQSQTTFNVSSSASSLPLQEGFETSTNVPAGWTINDPDNDGFKWVVSTTVGGFSTSSHCMAFDNCSPSTDITGRKDKFITVPYNFSSATAANMTFDVAYAYLVLSSVTYTDTLVVYSSIDCGTTWNQVYKKGGATLATAPNLTTASPTCFTPTATQWRNETINLNSLAGQSSVMFAFENRSDWAEWMYVDNINITSVIGIAENNPLERFNIYPNPASASFTIEGMTTFEKIQYSLYSLMGEEVIKGNIASIGNNFNGKVQVSDIAQGMYFLKVNDGKNIFTKKVNVQ